MTREEYLDEIYKRFEKHFEMQKNVEILGETIDLYAGYRNISGRTFITKNDVIDRCENYEYCYIKKYDTVTKEHAVLYGQFLKRLTEECIKPGKDHMSTYITGVIIGKGIENGARDEICRYSCSKIYSYYLRGWCDVRYICIGTDDNEVITNKAGKRVQKIYRIIQ